VNNFPDKTLVLVPHRPFSLWDMIRFHTKDFIKIWDDLDKATALSFHEKDKAANPDQQKALHALFVALFNLCMATQLRESAFLCKESLNWISDPAYHALTVPGSPGYKFPDQIPARPFSAVYTELQTIRKKIYEELDSVPLAVIPPDRANFFERDNLFGDEVKRACSAEINAEIKDAGNCLAADLNTAAIFHLMRVAESGMRALARHLKVKVKKNTIDSALWTEITNNIEEATGARWKKLPKAKKARKQATDFLKFCEVAANELNSFKEIWRNNVMHASGNYKASEALYVFERVNDFMQRLAKKIPLQYSNAGVTNGELQPAFPIRFGELHYLKGNCARVGEFDGVA